LIAPSQSLEMSMLTVAPAPMLTFSLIVPKEDCWKRKREEEHWFTTVRDAPCVDAVRYAKMVVKKRVECMFV